MSSGTLSDAHWGETSLTAHAGAAGFAHNPLDALHRTERRSLHASTLTVHIPHAHRDSTLPYESNDTSYSSYETTEPQYKGYILCDSCIGYEAQDTLLSAIIEEPGAPYEMVDTSRGYERADKACKPQVLLCEEGGEVAGCAGEREEEEEEEGGEALNSSDESVLGASLPRGVNSVFTTLPKDPKPAELANALAELLGPAPLGTLAVPMSTAALP